MKKLLAVFFMVFVLTVGANGKDLKEVLHINDGTFYVYFPESVERQEHTLRLANGKGTVLYSDSSFADSLNCAGAEGQTFAFHGDFSEVERIKRELRFVEVETGENGFYSVYGFSPRLKSGVTLHGKEINVQIVYKEGTVFIGSPMILGSY